jgi:hypothetical protein
MIIRTKIIKKINNLISINFNLNYKKILRLHLKNINLIKHNQKNSITPQLFNQTKQLDLLHSKSYPLTSSLNTIRQNKFEIIYIYKHLNFVILYIVYCYIIYQSFFSLWRPRLISLYLSYTCFLK